MQTECTPALFDFEPVERKKVVAGSDGGTITSDAGALLLRRLDRGLGLIPRMAICLTDRRDPGLLDSTDDPIHGEQEGWFFHGYYDCYCYLPLYIFCGRFLLCAKLRPSNIDGAAGAVDEVARIVARIRARWPKVRIVLRGDSGFCR